MPSASSDWPTINREIEAALRSSRPELRLLTLFKRTDDGHVAFTLGRILKEQGRVAEARDWFRRAHRRYPQAAYQQEALSQVRDADGPGALFVIPCTATKVWSRGGELRRFVPAQEAYTGQEFKRWLARSEARTARWVILSAKHGFLEPAEPIADYDITFGAGARGAISTESLRAQVMHQTRWSDEVSLRSFKTVYVDGSRDYFDRVQSAFMGSGARVLPFQAYNTLASPGRASVQADRISALGRALRTLPPSIFARADEHEPEWPFLLDLNKRATPDIATLVAAAVGFADYQLGAGGADAYWAAARRWISSRPVQAANDVLELLVYLCGLPVGKESRDQKLKRTTSLIRRWTTVPRLDITSGPQMWGRISPQPSHRHTKTVLMALKVVDLLTRIRTGKHLAFPSQLPQVPIDIHVVRLALVSGIVTAPGGMSLTRSKQLVFDAAPVFLNAWRRVADEVEVAPLRLDSLIWQLGRALGPDPLMRSTTSRHLRDHLRTLAAGDRESAIVVREMITFLK